MTGELMRPRNDQPRITRVKPSDSVFKVVAGADAKIIAPTVRNVELAEWHLLS